MKGQSDFTVSSSIIDEKKNIKPASAIGVEVIDLVEFMQSLSKKIDLIKIDIEGAEIQVLKKIIETRAYALFKTMYVETHETKIPGQKEELEKIKKELKRKEITNIKLNWI